MTNIKKESYFNQYPEKRYPEKHKRTFNPAIDMGKSVSNIRLPKNKRELAEKVSADVEAFLANGGQVTVIPNGISGEDKRLKRTVQENREILRRHGAIGITKKIAQQSV